jgi:hypothetical protein
MSNQNANGVAITKQDLAKQRGEAQTLIRQTAWIVREVYDSKDPTSIHVAGTSREREEKVSLTEIFDLIDAEDDLLSDQQMHVLRAIRQGLQLARHIAQSYSDRSGIPSSNRDAGLTVEQITEINEKKQTAAAIALFSFTRYVMWDIRELVSGNAFAGNIKVSIDEVELSRLVPALRAMVFYLGKNIEKQTLGDDTRLVAVVQQFAEQLQQEVLNRLGSLKHQTVFAGVSYLLEETDFSLSGFEVSDFTTKSEAQVKRVERDEVIGNSEAMTPLFRAIEKLTLYDVATQMNPIIAFGKFPSVLGFDGDPGNGKTLAMAAGATYFVDLATEMGLPHKVMVIPNFVDKYQGESDKAAQRWCADFQDPRSIKYGIGDEFEQVIPDHGNDDSSEGSKGVATAFLKAFDGVGTIIRGHSVFIYGTNYREKIDKAFLSRTNIRAYVGGAETLDDYIRFIVLMLKKINHNFPGLIKFKHVDWNMNLRAPQVADSDSALFVDPSATVVEVYNLAASMYEKDDIRFLAKFFWLMKRRFAAFSLRDCKNAIDGATAQVANFRVPTEFVNNSATYRDLPFVQKQGLLTELATAHIGTMGTDFVALLSERAQYYAGDALRTADIKHVRAVEELAGRMLVQVDAEAEIQKLLTARRAVDGSNVKPVGQV